MPQKETGLKTFLCVNHELYKMTVNLICNVIIQYLQEEVIQSCVNTTPVVVVDTLFMCQSYIAGENPPLIWGNKINK